MVRNFSSDFWKFHFGPVSGWADWRFSSLELEKLVLYAFNNEAIERHQRDE